MKRITVALLLMLALVFSTVSIAGAITDGKTMAALFLAQQRLNS